MSGHAMQNMISETVSRPRRWRALGACLLLAALCGAAEPAFAQRAFARRFPAPAAQPLVTRGDIDLIGNTSLTCSPALSGCTAARNGSGRNNDFNPMVAVDVDSDASTTNSS